MANDDKKQNASDKTADAYKGMSADDLFTALKIVIEGSQKTDPALLAVAEALKANTEQQNRLHRPSNQFSPGISVFSHPEGEVEHPKEKLVNDTFFEGMKQSDEQLTPREIELFNAINVSKEARQGRWQAIFKKNPLGKKGWLSVNVNISGQHDEGLQLPPLVQILLELTTGADASDVVKLMEQLAALTDQVKAMKEGRDAGLLAPSV